MKILSMVLCAFLVACSSYGPAGGSGTGYRESQLEPSIYRVIFRGSGNDRYDEVEEMALLRCAELMKQNGYPYFVVLLSSEQSFNQQLAMPIQGRAYGNTVSFTGGNSVNVQSHTVIKTVMGYKSMPAQGPILESQKIIDLWAPRYKR